MGAFRFVRFHVKKKKPSHMCTYQSSVSIISVYLSFPNLDFDSRTALNELWARSHDSHYPPSSESYLLSISHRPSLASGSDSTHVSSVCLLSMCGVQTAAGMARQVESDAGVGHLLQLRPQKDARSRTRAEITNGAICPPEGRVSLAMLPQSFFPCFKMLRERFYRYP